MGQKITKKKFYCIPLKTTDSVTVVRNFFCFNKRQIYGFSSIELILHTFSIAEAMEVFKFYLYSFVLLVAIPKNSAALANNFDKRMSNFSTEFYLVR